MPLVMARRGEKNTIKRILGGGETRRHLENLGFIPGSSVEVINTLGGSLIVAVKDVRVALSRELAEKILV